MSFLTGASQLAGKASGVAGAIGTIDAKPRHYIQGQGKVTKTLQDQLLADLGFYDDNLAKFNTGVDAAIKRTDELRPLATADYQSLIDSGMKYDSNADWLKNLEALFSAYTGAGNKVGDWTNLGMDVNAHKLNMGGRPSDAYYGPAISRNITSMLFPALAAGVNTLPQQSLAASTGRLSNIESLQNIIKDRSGTATQGMELALAPISARLGTRSATYGGLDNLNRAAASGTSGFQASPDPWARAAMALSALGAEGGGGNGSMPGVGPTFGNPGGPFAQPGYKPASDWSVPGNSDATNNILQKLAALFSGGGAGVVPL